MRLLALALVLAGCGPAKWRATPQQLAPLDPLPVLASRTGPLSVHEAPPQTSWNATLANRRLTEDRYLDAPRIEAETSAWLAVIEAFYQPLTPETRIGFDQVHRSAATLSRLAPYSMWNVSLAYQQASERLHLCIHHAGLMGSCFRDWAQTPRPVSDRPYRFHALEPGIAMLTVHALTEARWPGFEADARRALAGAKGLVIDLRDAAGGDPRALLPWVAKLAGRSELRPLRAIERPAIADRYVAAYAANYRDRGRDPELWRTLVGDTPPPTSTPTRLPITIVVGRYCHAACEVIARVLATYANATVLGGVGRTGRAARDEPAMLYLPHSQTRVYFHATRYLFSSEIEAATGPSEEWQALVAGDPFGDNPHAPSSPPRFQPADLFAFAIRDITHRAAHPEGWARCDAALPETGRKVIELAHGCPDLLIRVKTSAPTSVMRRFLATCASPVEAGSYLPGELWLRKTPSAEILAGIAASELVEGIETECQGRVYPN